ncbi:MAG: TRAP transporter small permease [Pseudolabrys sp.]|jgi:TRAP-type mannitol/chloroaromatic compound transport system permease small subunit|nr:TRAP transporter small permease [Pseudolabrys sp.]
MTGSSQPSPRRLSPFGLLAEGMGAIGTLWIFFLMLLINADVIGRYFFNKPLEGTTEIVSMSIVGIIYLQMGLTLRHERFIRSDVLIGGLLTKRPRAGYALQALHHLIGAALVGLMVYFAAPFAYDTWQQGDYLGTEGVFVFYTWPINAIATTGAAVACIQFLLLGIRDLRVCCGLMPPPETAAAATEVI